MVVMKMVGLNIQVPLPLKAKLDTLRARGTSASGYIRSILQRELNAVATIRKGR